MPDPSFANPKSEFQLGKDDLQLSDYDRELASKLLRPETFLLIPEGDRLIGYLAERLVLSGLNLPVSQIQGFAAFGANLDVQAASSATTSTTYANLADGAHPELTGLANGLYAVMFGAVSTGTGTHTIGLHVNGSAPTSDAEVATIAGGHWWALVTLSSADNNTLTIKYKGSDGTSVAWQRRYLFALKYTNA